MSELKRCPFCGGEAKVHYDYYDFALVQCSGCGIGTLHKGDEKDVIADWNTRKPVDAVPVVRCKDCKHWGMGVAGETERVKCCEYGRYMVGENGYCVYGEKKV